MAEDKGLSGPGKGNHPNSRAALQPVQAGEVRNPEGRNQYTHREEAQEHTDREVSKKAIDQIVEVIAKEYELALAGSTVAIKNILDRVSPLVKRVDVELPGDGVSELVDGLTAFFAKRRDDGGDVDPHASSEEGGG